MPRGPVGTLSITAMVSSCICLGHTGTAPLSPQFLEDVRPVVRIAVRRSVFQRKEPCNSLQLSEYFHIPAPVIFSWLTRPPLFPGLHHITPSSLKCSSRASHPSMISSYVASKSPVYHGSEISRAFPANCSSLYTLLSESSPMM